MMTKMLINCNDKISKVRRYFVTDHN